MKYIKIFKILLFGVILTSLVGFTSDDKKYSGYDNHYKTINGVEIHYKWAKDQWWKKDSPLRLMFKMNNTNDYDVHIKFELLYLDDQVIKASSGILESDIPKHKMLVGKINGFYFAAPKNITKEKFEWEISQFKVEKL